MLPLRAQIIAIQIVGWILFLSLVVLFVNNRADNANFFSTLISLKAITFFVTYIFIFYLNAYLLIPKLYHKKKFILYIASLLILLFAVGILKPFDSLMNNNRRNINATVVNAERPLPPQNFNEPPPRRPAEDAPGPRFQDRRASPRVDIISVILFILTLALSFSLHIQQQLRFSQQRILKAETDKANAELSFLKTQINPHFLFNTLNNLYALAVTKSENTAAGIMKLSNIMRYFTDEVQEDFVPLKHEVDCIQDYIGLQSLRISKSTTVNMDVSGELENRRIAPLILMTFVENAFKHGISNREPSEIVIRLLAEEGNINFICWNKLFAAKKNTERTGIGLTNVKQRLDYLYPGKYSLNIKTEEDVYTVQLTLQL